MKGKREAKISPIPAPGLANRGTEKLGIRVAFLSRNLPRFSRFRIAPMLLTTCLLLAGSTIALSTIALALHPIRPNDSLV